MVAEKVELCCLGLRIWLGQACKACGMITRVGLVMHPKPLQHVILLVCVAFILITGVVHRTEHVACVRCCFQPRPSWCFMLESDT